MGLARGSTLIVAALISSPALWQAFVTHEATLDEALFRYLVAVPVAAIMLWVLRAITAPYRASSRRTAIRAFAERLDEERVAARARAEQQSQQLAA